MMLLGTLVMLLPVAAQAQELTRPEQEEFLRTASVSSERELSPGTLRVSLDDGNRKHNATVQNVDLSNPSHPDVYRFDVAAYELDKLLRLNMVPPSVERAVKGKPSVVIWWADNVAMSEVDRRKQNVQPPDMDAWDKQMQAVRVFDELISNAYRNVRPEFYQSTIWDNLLITHDWTAWIIDYKASFAVDKQLETPTSLIRCDRTVLRQLRALNRDVVKQKLGQILTPAQLDALEARRKLLVKHFDQLIAKKVNARCFMTSRRDVNPGSWTFLIIGSSRTSF